MIGNIAPTTSPIQANEVTSTRHLLFRKDSSIEKKMSVQNIVFVLFCSKVSNTLQHKSQYFKVSVHLVNGENLKKIYLFFTFLKINIKLIIVTHSKRERCLESWVRVV